MSDPTTTNGKNGNGSRIPFLILSLTAPPLLGVVIGWITTINTRLTNHTEKIAVIESQLQDTREQLRSINQKIDKLLERRP